MALALSLDIHMVDPFGADLHRVDLRAMLERAEGDLRREGWSEEALRGLLPEVFPTHRARDGREELVVRRRPPLFGRAAAQVFAWLVAERQYQLEKFGTDLDDDHTKHGLPTDGWWWQQLTNYYGRAKVLGLDLPAGRQALAKFTATACGLLESAVRVHGDLPAPGVPSGELQMKRPYPGTR